MVHEAWGLDDMLRRQADHLASLGYLVLAPDLFSQGGRLRCLVPTFQAMRRGRGAAFDDVATCRRYLLRDPECSGSVGVIGFCTGGGFALLTTTSGFDTATPCFGVLPTSPQVLRGGCPVVASYGDRDSHLADAPASSNGR